MSLTPGENAADGPEAAGEEGLWKRLRHDGCAAARCKLLELYDSLARQVAAGVFAKRPDDAVEFEDYLQYARVGLLEAVDRYKPGGEASFRTFATYRIRGAVLNGISKENDQREQAACHSRLKRERLESLAEDGTAKQSEFEHLVEVAIGLALGHMLEETGLVRDGGAASQDSPYDISEYLEVCSRVREAVESLPEREALIVRYHYFQEMSFEAVADVLSLSKGRVSQLHKRALLEIRRCLTAAGIDRAF